MSKRTMIAMVGAAGLAAAAALPGNVASAQAGPVLAQAQQGQPGTGQGGRGMGPGGGGMGPGGGGMGQGPGGGPGMQQGRMFEQLDRDGDGSLSREEFVEGERPGTMSSTGVAQQNREQMFDQLDRDGDGRLSLDEMPTRRGGAAR